MGLVIGIVIVFGIMAIAALHIHNKEAARRELMARPLPPAWARILRDVRLYHKVPRGLREQLHGFIQVFVAEKRFEGCGGQEITDEIRVTVAALACMMSLGHHRGIYPKLETILVYPGAYVGRVRRRAAWGMEVEGDVRAGESWTRGPVVLAWEDALAQARGEDIGHNVIVHEFAHQLDQEDGFADGATDDRNGAADLREVLAEEFEEEDEGYSDGYEENLLDDYGKENMAEAFAVASEMFFEVPEEMQERHPRLYEKLKEYYGLDTAGW